MGDNDNRPYINMVQAPIPIFQYDLRTLFYDALKARRLIIKDQAEKRKVHRGDQAELYASLDSLLVVLKPKLKLQKPEDYPLMNKLSDSMKDAKLDDLTECVKEVNTLLDKIGILETHPDTSIKG